MLHEQYPGQDTRQLIESIKADVTLRRAVHAVFELLAPKHQNERS